MKVQLSGHFTYRRLLRFVVSPILMMIFISLYSAVDGFFVSNFVGKTPFAAVNLILPVMMGVATVGFMASAGGSAVVSKTLGEGEFHKANEYFSLLILVTLGVSLALSAACFFLIRPISAALGATDDLLANCVTYGRILSLSAAPFIMQVVFQSFLITAGKPDLSFRFCVLGGVTNMVLDYLFIVPLQWGLAGAALATTLGQVVSGILPIFYFARENPSLLRLVRPRWYGRVLVKTCTNGASEMVTNLSGTVVGVLYNFQLLRLAGADSVAAYGIIMYVNFIFSGIFYGYSIGSGPLVGFHYGAENKGELQNLFWKSCKLLLGTGVLLTALAELAAGPLVKMFASYDPELMAMATRGFRLCSLAFLTMGVTVWGSSFFTALSNGAVSAVISFLRTLVFQTSAVLLLPLVLGLDGVWMAIVVSQAASLAVTVFFFRKMGPRYGYLRGE